jgi:hypothetical protein
VQNVRTLTGIAKVFYFLWLGKGAFRMGLSQKNNIPLQDFSFLSEDAGHGCQVVLWVVTKVGKIEKIKSLT